MVVDEYFSKTLSMSKGGTKTAKRDVDCLRSSTDSSTFDADTMNACVLLEAGGGGEEAIEEPNQLEARLPTRLEDVGIVAWHALLSVSTTDLSQPKPSRTFRENVVHGDGMIWRFPTHVGVVFITASKVMQKSKA